MFEAEYNQYAQLNSSEFACLSVLHSDPWMAVTAGGSHGGQSCR